MTTAGSQAPAVSALLRPDGTAVLVRVTPDIESVAAMLGDWAYGFSPSGATITFWAVMPEALIFMDGADGPHGSSAPNPLAGEVALSLTGEGHRFRGPVLAVPDDDPAALLAAVERCAATVRCLTVPEPRGEDDWDGPDPT